MKAKLPHLTPGVPIAYTLESEDGKKVGKRALAVTIRADPKSPARTMKELPNDFTDEFERKWGLRQA
nr:hypothetical protein [Rhizobium sp. CCGE531]